MKQVHVAAKSLSSCTTLWSSVGVVLLHLLVRHCGLIVKVTNASMQASNPHLKLSHSIEILLTIQNFLQVSSPTNEPANRPFSFEQEKEIRILDQNRLLHYRRSINYSFDLGLWWSITSICYGWFHVSAFAVNIVKVTLDSVAICRDLVTTLRRLLYSFFYYLKYAPTDHPSTVLPSLSQLILDHNKQFDISLYIQLRIQGHQTNFYDHHDCVIWFVPIILLDFFSTRLILTS
jgi:hypothetical protein